LLVNSIYDLIARRRSLGRARNTELKLNIECHGINALQRYDRLWILNDASACLQNGYKSILDF
jgi:hypothetical protein